MPKLGAKSKLAAIAGIVAIALVVIGRLFFPVSRPALELAANYSEPFYKLGPIYITNTLITSWLSIIVLIGHFLFRHPQDEARPQRSAEYRRMDYRNTP